MTNAVAVRRRRRRRALAALLLIVVGGAGVLWLRGGEPLPIRARWPADGIRAAIGITSDNRYLLLNHDGGGLTARDLATGVDRPLAGSRAGTGAVATSPDGRFHALALYDVAAASMSVLVLDSAGAERARIVPGGWVWVQAAFVPDGSALVVMVTQRFSGRAPQVREVQIWDTATWTLRASHTPPAALSLDLPAVLAADGGAIVARDAIDPLGVCLWTLPGFRRRTLRVESGPGGAHVWGLGVSPDGARIAAGLSDGAVRVWDATSGRSPATLRGHRRGVGSGLLVFSADGRFVASYGIRTTAPPVAVQLGQRLFGSGFAAADPAEVVVWDLATGRRVASLPGEERPIFSPDGRSLVTTRIGRSVTLWELPAAGGR